MSGRSIRVATVGLLTLCSVAAAQQNPPPPAPPATPTPTPTPPAAPPQAAPPAAAPQTPQADPEARHTTKIELGDAKVTLDHGAPPWNDQRLADMAQAV